MQEIQMHMNRYPVFVPKKIKMVQLQLWVIVMGNRVKASIDTRLTLSPEKSQTFLVILLISSTLLIFLGMFFLWHGKTEGWFSSIIGLLLGIAAFCGWLQSQKSIDMGNAPPTVFSGQGVSLSTDARTFASSDSTIGLMNVLCTIMEREPLPEASGIIDHAGVVHKDAKSLKSAKERIDCINELSHKHKEHVISEMKKKLVKQTVIDSSIELSPEQQQNNVALRPEVEE